MKKSLIALAALAAVTAASAQSTVTISGLYRAGYQNDMTNTAANGTLLTANSEAKAAAAAKSVVRGKGLAITDVNIKFDAVEDLGGGLKANFDVLFENGNFRTAPLTRADSGIGASGAFGAVALRNTRQSDAIASIGSTAVNVPDGLYDSSAIITRVAIDTLSYTSPELIKGLKASVTYVELGDGAVSTAATNSSAYVLGATYANGPLSAAGAYKMKPAKIAAVSGLTAKANVEFAVTYDFGVAKVAYAYDGASAQGASTNTTIASGSVLTAAQTQQIANLQTKAANGFSLTVPMGALSAGVNYFKRGDQTVTEFGVRYDLSKRTYLAAASGKKSGLFDADGYQGSQSRVALSHTF
jgi:predicted porin